MGTKRDTPGSGADVSSAGPCGQNKRVPKSVEISHRHKERNAQDFRAVYFNLFLVILPKFGSLFYTTVIPYKPLYGTPLLGLPVV